MCACLLLVGPGQVLAADTDREPLQALEESMQEYLGEVDLEQTIDLEDGLLDLFERGKTEVSGVLRGAVRSGTLILAVVLFCALAEGMPVGPGGQALSAVTLTGALAVTAVAVTDIHALIGLGTQAIDRMETFSKVLLPAVTVVSAAAGTPAAATARQLATMFFSDLLLTLINRLLLPLVYAYIAACAANAALGNNGIRRLAELIRWVVTSTLTVLLLLFVSYLTVSGVIAGNTDAAAIKAAKFAVSGMVPVVGGILSDAAESVLAGAAILKNTVGAAGMLAVLAICLTPFLHLGLHYLTYKLTAALTAVVSDGPVSSLVSLIGGAFGMVLGMTGACALLLLISIVSAITAVAR